MREIKLRAWDDFHKRFTQYMIESYDNGEVKIFFKKTNNNYSDWQISENKNRFKLMQYTGLNDKNNIEIYSGDIVKRTATNPYWNKALIEIGVVIFKNASFTTNKFSLTISSLNEYYTNNYEVIGNIYENPELLNKI